MSKHSRKKAQRKRKRMDKTAAVVNAYLAVVENYFEMARNEEKDIVQTSGCETLYAEGQDALIYSSSGASTIWAWLRNSRIFAIPSSLYDQTWVALADALIGPGKVMESADVVCDKAEVLPFPEQLPFEHTYLGFDETVWLDENQMRTRLSPKVLQDAPETEMGVVGYLITHHGYVFEFLRMRRLRFDKNGTVRPVEGIGTASMRDPNVRGKIRSDGRIVKAPWESPQSLVPWIIHAFVDLINDNHTLVIEQKPNREVRRAVAQKSHILLMDKPVPPPFYTLSMRDTTVIERVTQRHQSVGKIKMQYSHQFDVRGHERVRVRRGPLPLDPDEQIKLTKQGYRVYTDQQPCEGDRDRVLRRRMPRKHDREWMAVKVSWVNSYQKGPEDAPYIPSVRTMPSVRAIRVAEETIT